MKDEAKLTLEKFFKGDNNSLYYFGDESYVSEILDIILKGNVFFRDRPDIFFKLGNKSLIIEHFEFDCYSNNRKVKNWII